MNTKTMRLPPRRVLTANKLKGGEDLDAVNWLRSAKPSPKLNTPQAGSHKAAAAVSEPAGSNHLLAGYLAEEFLTKGTLFGEPWDSRAEAAQPIRRDEAEPDPVQAREDKRRRYTEISHLLKGDGTHLAGVVNPAQLSKFLKL